MLSVAETFRPADRSAVDAPKLQVSTNEQANTEPQWTSDASAEYAAERKAELETL